jgi:mannose-6-phosphate isomerase
MFLPAGELHAYLDGVGIELMANSDNVLRGGLTPKHIDVKELMSVLTFRERHLTILDAEKISETERVYPTQADEFVLSVITLKKGLKHSSTEERSVEILLCMDGKATIRQCGRDEAIIMEKGNSVIVPASINKYLIEGDAIFYKAAVPM